MVEPGVLYVPVDEILDQPETVVLAFLRVKLHREQVVPCRGRGKGYAVDAAADLVFRVLAAAEVTVHEIKAGTVFYAVPQRVIGHLLHVVPAHVRNGQVRIDRGQVGCKVFDLARKQAQAGMPFILRAGFEQRLQAQADSQHGLVAQDLGEHLADVLLLQLFHPGAHGSLSGEDYPLGVTYDVGKVADYNLFIASDVLNRLGHRAQVACAQIYNNYRHLQRTFRRGYDVAGTRIRGDGHTQGTSECLEKCFSFMVIITAIKHMCVQITSARN